jgi:hypothetical protein
MSVERNIPRAEPPSPELFNLDLPENAEARQLKQMYRGKPILFE